MAPHFPGFGLVNKPSWLISLSGGGYRAALFHAGVLRALRVADVLTKNGRETYSLGIAAVSGGCIPAILWQWFLDAPNAGELWPEEAVLDLVTHGPHFPRLGKLGLYFSGKQFRRAWLSHLDSWWRSSAQRLGDSDDAKRYGHARMLVVAELLDFESGAIFGISDGALVQLDEEYFKYGTRPFALDTGPVIPVDTIFHATAFPIFFSPWLLESSAEHPDLARQGTYRFIDAGLIDNNAVLAFLPFLTSALWREQARPKTWFVSDAGARMSVRDEARHTFAGGLTKPVRNLTFDDRAFRMSGDLAQRAYFGVLLDLVKSLRLVDRLLPIKAGTETEPPPLWRGIDRGPEPLWISTEQLNTPGALADAPTTLAPINRDDALAILCHGAQLASAVLGIAEASRESLKADLLGLR